MDIQTTLNIALGITSIIYIIIMIISVKEKNEWKARYYSVRDESVALKKDIEKREQEHKLKDEFISNLRYNNKEIESLYYKLLNVKDLKSKICKE